MRPVAMSPGPRFGRKSVFGGRFAGPLAEASSPRNAFANRDLHTFPSSPPSATGIPRAGSFVRNASIMKAMTDEDPAAPSMRLGGSGLRVPRLGLGVMTWGDMSTAPRWNPARAAYGPTSSIDDQREALRVYRDVGVTLVDTAAMYGKGASERRVGELTEGFDVLVATKFPSGFFSRAGGLPATLDASLARLRRTTVDLYQVHFPSRWMSIPELMNLMADAVEAGRVHAVGVSNYSAKQLREAHGALADRGIPLASNQVQYSLLHRDPEVNGVLDACRELGLTLIAYMPLASGALSSKYSATHRPRRMAAVHGRFPGQGPGKARTSQRCGGRPGHAARHVPDAGRPALAPPAAQRVAHPGREKRAPGHPEHRGAVLRPDRIRDECAGSGNGPGEVTAARTPAATGRPTGVPPRAAPGAELGLRVGPKHRGQTFRSAPAAV